MMETSGGGSAPYRNQPSSGGSTRRYGVQFPASNFIQAPLSALLEYAGFLQPSTSDQESESMLGGAAVRDHRLDEPTVVSGGGGGEVSIRIIGVADQENPRVGSGQAPASGVGLRREEHPGGSDAVPGELIGDSPGRQDGDVDIGEAGSSFSSVPSTVYPVGDQSTESGTGNATGTSNRGSSYQRYDIQQLARWIEQILPFSLLLMVVFIRQHLQGFFVTIWIAVVMFKSNDILRKQTALKGERKIFVLVGITLVFVIHVFGVYWWYKNGDLLYPLVMLPPREIPPFWHAIFIIMVNGVFFTTLILLVFVL